MIDQLVSGIGIFAQVFNVTLLMESAFLDIRLIDKT
jgi:hypothetical protein